MLLRRKNFYFFVTTALRKLGLGLILPLNSHSVNFRHIDVIGTQTAYYTGLWPLKCEDFKYVRHNSQRLWPWEIYLIKEHLQEHAFFQFWNFNFLTPEMEFSAKVSIIKLILFFFSNSLIMDVKRLQSAGFPKFVAISFIQSTLLFKNKKLLYFTIFAENYISGLKKFIFQTLKLTYGVLCTNWIVALKARVFGSCVLHIWNPHNPAVTALCSIAFVPFSSQYGEN